MYSNLIIVKASLKLAWWLSSEEPPVNAGDTGSIPGSGKIPWRREWQPSPAFFPGKSHGQRSLPSHKRVGHDLATKPPKQLSHSPCTKWLQWYLLEFSGESNETLYRRVCFSLWIAPVLTLSSMWSLQGEFSLNPLLPDSKSPNPFFNQRLFPSFPMP